MAYDPKKHRTRKMAPQVDYTARDFSSIKRGLVEHVKRYYPDTFSDFNEASFGSMMLDTVAYVGDVMSFYLDYQANESFIDSATEFDNVVRHAQRLGFDPFEMEASSSGIITVYVKIPSTVTGKSPDLAYAPILRSGASFESVSGVRYLLTEDIDFSLDMNEYAVAEVDSTTGEPVSYAVKAYGRVISGTVYSVSIAVGQYESFRRVSISDPNIVEIMSVTDTDGNPYYEVDYLSQDVIYTSVINEKYASQMAGESKHLLKPFAVPRRFTTERDGDRLVLQFGTGHPDTESEGMVDPATMVMSQYGKSYTADESFDPTRLIRSDSLGICPANTTLTIVYRANDSTRSSNAATGTVTALSGGEWEWKNLEELNTGKVTEVIRSFECTNEVPMLGESTLPTTAEIRIRAKGAHAAQNRAVTKQDYEALVYALPTKFGSVKRCSVQRDNESLKRNLNVYVISDDFNNRLVPTPTSIKNNIKTWLSSKKMMNDTIDIISARRLSLGLTYSILVSSEQNKHDILANCNHTLEAYFKSYIPEIGEPFGISDVYRILNAVGGVDDVLDIEVEQKTGSSYGDLKFDIASRTTPDRRLVMIPSDVIWEVRFPGSDVKGAAK